MNLVFGIDGGGTGCRLRVETLAGELVAQAQGGPLNPRSQAEEQLAATLSRLFGDLPPSASSPAGFCGGFVGCAGADREPEQRLIERMLRRATGYQGPMAVGNDAQTVLAGATEEGAAPYGTVLIAGTGSLAWSRCAEGVSRCGGYGHLLGDEGSAWWLAREGLSRAIRQAEEQGHSPLLEAILTFWSLSSAQDLIPFVYTDFDKARIARAARVVEAQRLAGDALAGALFDQARDDLVALAVRARAKMATGSELLVLHGGLLEGNLWYQQACRQALTSVGFTVKGPGIDATQGACRLARLLF